MIGRRQQISKRLNQCLSVELHIVRFWFYQWKVYTILLKNCKQRKSLFYKTTRKSFEKDLPDGNLWKIHNYREKNFFQKFFLFAQKIMKVYCKKWMRKYKWEIFSHLIFFLFTFLKQYKTVECCSSCIQRISLDLTNLQGATDKCKNH